jgi:deferrochelatase/peroxidase EfeB
MKRSTIRQNETFLNDHGADIQANIFAPHRRDHVLLLFLHLNGDETTRSMLETVLNSLGRNSDSRQGLYLTSVKNQREIEQENNPDPDLFCNCYLTADGLRKLKGDSSNWTGIHSHLEASDHTRDLNGRDQWDLPYRESRQVHAVLLLAHPQAEALQRKKAPLVSQYFPRIGVGLLFEEQGQVYRQRFYTHQRRGFAVEHFGYADGLSNPWITEKDTKYKGKAKPRKHWNPITPAKEFIVKEPGGTGRWGSYLVYRKYEQHLDRFSDATHALAEKLGVSQEEAGALAFGRRKDGSSLELNANPGATPELSDFLFSPAGKCPVFAHTRKVNDRAHPKEGLPKKLKYPIMRRGVTYGERRTVYNGAFDPRKIPGHPVGLLFMSFQNRIDKFQQLLQHALQEEPDPILGHLGEPEKPIRHHIEGLDEPYEGFGGFVSLRGGLNLYAPSISFFKELSLTPATGSTHSIEGPVVQKNNSWN